MFDYEVEHLFSIVARLQGAPEVIGELPGGFRLNFRVAEGSVEGPKLRGVMRGGAVDCYTWRRDGVGLVDVRATIGTHDGALIGVAYAGVADAGEGAFERLLCGDIPRAMPMRVAARFEASHADYRWLNRLQCIGIGQTDIPGMQVSYDFYGLT